MADNDLNKTLSDIMENMDKKTLQDNLLKALDTLKQSNADDLANQINSACNSSQNTSDKQSLDKLNVDTNAIKNINPSELEKLINYIGSHGDEVKDKLKDVINKE
ncbi:hypothetical protein RBH29_10465 [Herbivorax sp. ANBcel31]|uniref:hypothetical protein n=1 Tax=Herbivorax sp. ANBcel31 TaxID=3069754 RepID=UPI0027AEBB7A|nr:hypothetical protein [Herbivorax sp. ANBcel31]MDQ2086848.1 hypothetical protein [Herbivorax sp. ANBcel31]